MRLLVCVLAISALVSCHRNASSDGRVVDEGDSQPNAAENDADDEQPRGYLALGDSYTIGESVAEDARFPVVLAERLGLDPPELVARTGWTTTDLGSAMDARSFEAPYELVTLLIGVNDQFQGSTAEAYRPRFRQLTQRAIELADGRPEHVIVVSIPDYGVTPFGQQRDPERIAEEIDAFNAVNRAESDALGVHYVDITPISRRADDQPELVADDGLHPSPEMYRLWVDAIEPVALDVIGK